MKKLNTRILPTFGHIQVVDLTVRDLENAYYAWVSQVSVTTVRNYHRVINTILNFGERQYPGRFTNPARNVRQPRAVERDATTPNDSALLAIVEAAEAADLKGRNGIRSHRLMVHLAASTGARRGELAALRWSDVDMTAGTIRITRSVAQSPNGEVEKGTKTAKSKRVVPIVNGLWDDLHAQQQRRTRVRYTYSAMGMAVRV